MTMNTLGAWLMVLPALLVLALLAWAVATARRNVGLVDIVWSLFFLLAAVWLAVRAGPALDARSWIVLAIVASWSLRLAGYLALRNWNAPEDHRYQAIRRRNEPGFVWKSVYLVFGLQAVLAWLIAAPIVAAMTTSIAGPAGPTAAAAMGSGATLGVLDAIGAALALTGFTFEAIGDAQLARFKANPANAGRVLDSGLWRYTRHPNYFGECCVWWGLFVIALGAGGWWTVFSPLLMTLLLLKVSGVALLERDIAERRPAYRDYVARTNAFIPGPPRKA